MPLTSLFERYLFLHFLKRILFFLLAVALIVFLFDFLETSRRFSHSAHIDITDIVLITAFRVPIFLERVFPFATLFGAMATLITLSMRSELIVIRTAGISVWQFITPGLILAIILGIFSFTLYSPLAVWLKREAEKIEISASDSQKGFLTLNGRKIWLRQETATMRTIFHAAHLLEETPEDNILSDVSVYLFNKEGFFTQRLEARKARIEHARWHLSDVIRYRPGLPPETQDSLFLPATLTDAEIRQKILEPDALSFWQLPAFIALLRRSGLPTQAYRLSYHAWLSMPVLLCAMVLIACVVSLRHTREGGVQHFVLLGILAGFLLYVIVELTRDLGSAGIINPVMATWFPPLIAIFLALTFLLYKEDG